MIELLESRRLLSGTGLQGTYFDNSNFTGKTVSRLDPTVNFSWSGSPISGISSDTFSVRWTGQIQPAYSQTYTFYTTSDDGVRLWVDHKMIISRWSDHPPTQNQASIALVAGQKYDLQLEFYDNTGGATCQLRYSSPSVAKQIIPASKLYPTSQNLRDKLDHALVYAASQVNRTILDLGSATTTYVSTTKSDGTWNKIGASDWRAGFLPGALWQLYSATGNSYWKDQATKWTTGLAGQRFDKGDLAFRIFTTFKPLYDATGSSTYRQYIQDAAASKNSMWNETVGAFRADWGMSTSGNPLANFPVLIDQTTDMELMFWAAKASGIQQYYDRALRHLKTVIAHMIRPDGSTFQFGYFDKSSGNFIDGETYQGYSNSSTWSRGQAWAVYSLATSARDTNDSTVLAAAKKVADYFIAHLPSSEVPYWDFNDPSIPNAYRDSSAAAVAASGLIQIAKLVKTSDATAYAKYRGAAESILSALASPPFFSEGSASRGILLHGALNVPHDSATRDCSLIFGDYYFLDAINRYRSL